MAPQLINRETHQGTVCPYFSTWLKRERQIDKVVKSIGGMHGDLEGINGPSLPVVKMLELNS